jgi:endonuclease/exonuclease/phosphatase family metal-dependent hydrolase
MFNQIKSRLTSGFKELKTIIGIGHILVAFLIITILFLIRIIKHQKNQSLKDAEMSRFSQKTNIRIMSWNSEWVSSSEKAHEMKGSKSFVLDAIRRVCNIISKNNPDIAILNEISDVPTLQTMADYLKQKYKINYNVYMYENRKQVEHKQFSGVFIKKFLDPENNIDIIPIYSWYRNFHFLINIGGKKIRFFSVHLKADGKTDKSEIRKTQLQDVARIALDAEQRGENIIIMGDFNQTYGDVLYNTLTKKGFVNVMFTHKSTTNPYRSFTQWSDYNNDELIQSHEIRDLDHVFVNNNLYKSLATVYIDRFTAQKVHETDPTSRVSDHWPIIVEFGLMEEDIEHDNGLRTSTASTD